MIDIISILLLFLGIFLIRFANKKNIKSLKNSGVILVILCLLCILPSFLSGVYNGFKDASISLKNDASY